MKKVFRIIGIVLLVIVLIVGGYFAYLFIDYHRLPDLDDALEFGGGGTTEAAKTGESYAIATWNLGFGAYSAD